MKKTNELNFLRHVYPSPLRANETWNIVDPSKIKAFQECERSFFFKYVLGWRTESESNHLIFGKAWHVAMEVIRINGVSRESLDLAFIKFNEIYRKYFPEATDLHYAPKHPGNVRVALEEYAKRLWHRERIKNLHTEVLVYAPVDESGRYLCGRIDTIDEYSEKGIVITDFKTGSRRSAAWGDQWRTSDQMFFYHHAAHLAYPNQRFFGVMVEGAFFYKNPQKDVGSNVAFERVPIRKSDDMVVAWLADLNHHLDMLEWNFEGLSKTSPDDKVMSCFPRRPVNCTRYNRSCPFMSFCQAWANPLKHCSEVPPGFKVEFWDPAKDEDRPPKVVIEG